jgi:Glycosyl transferase family 2
MQFHEGDVELTAHTNGKPRPGSEVATQIQSTIAVPAHTPVFVPVQDNADNHERTPARELTRRKEGLTVSVVIPTLNEGGNIGPVLRSLARFDHIVLVDGLSSDGTVELARAVRPDITVVERAPRGKGDALRAGFDAATGDVIVIMDADGSMDPGEVEVFLSMMAVGFDLVKGSRLAVGGGSHDLTTIRLLGNAALCKLANTLFHTHWTDLCYGYLAFRRSCLPKLALTADGFEIESQILGHAALAGLRIAEIPSVEMPRLSGDSHLNARRDGTRILRAMLAARFAPRARRSAAALRPLVVSD